MLAQLIILILVVIGTAFATFAYVEEKLSSRNAEDCVDSFSNGVAYAKRNAAQVLSHEEAYNVMIQTLTAEERYHSSNQIGR